MSIHKTEALVLRTYEFRESSLIVSFFTRDFGKLTGLAKGIRRKECRFASRLLPLSLNQIVFYRSRRGMIHTLSECILEDGFFPLRQDLLKLAAASYLAELVDELTKWEDRNEPLFQLLLDAWRRMSPAGYRPGMVSSFEIKALELTGFGPKLDACAGCGRPVESPHRFSVKKGGLLCPACSRAGIQADEISDAAVNALKRMKKNGAGGNLPEELTVPLERELRLIVRKFVYFQIEKPSRAFAFLEGVERAGNLWSGQDAG